MQTKMLLMTMLSIGLCSGLPFQDGEIRKEPRKFVYQVGYPSVRRYPVYPDRLDSNDDSHMVVKPFLLNKAKKDEALLFEAKKPEMMKFDRMDSKMDMMPDAMEEDKSTSSSTMPLPASTTMSTITTTTSTTTTTTTTTPMTTTTTSDPVTSESIFDVEEETTSPEFEGFSFTPKSSDVHHEEALLFPSSSSSSVPSSSPVSFFNNTEEEEEEATNPLNFFGNNTLLDFGSIAALLPDPLFPIAKETEETPGSSTAGEEEILIFGSNTEQPAIDITDTVMMTEVPVNEIIEEETMMDSTMPPSEDETLLEEFQRFSTDSSILDETATDNSFDSVTQQFFTTEEIEIF